MTTGAKDHFLDYEKSLACIHCGLCLSSCPTYLETGNENDSPRGRIYLMRAIEEGRLDLEGGSVRHIDLCLGCRACEAVCPSGVQYGALLEATRDHVEKRHGRSLWQRFLRRIVIEQIFPFANRMRLALLPALLLRRLKLTILLPSSLRDALALLPERMIQHQLSEITPSETERKVRTGFVSGCVMSVLFAETNIASIRLLARAGYEVVTPREQVCCGALFAHSGQLEKARACARRNIEAFEKAGLDVIAINAAGCGSTLKEYGHLLHDDPDWSSRANAFSAKVRDLTELLPKTACKASPSDVVTVHDACHLAHAQRITKPPRELVKAKAHDRFVELPEADVCCGSAGSYNLTEPEMAARLQKRKVENIIR